MLNFSQKIGEPIIIGDAVVFIRPKKYPNGESYSDIVEISIDAPRDIKVYRDDLVHRELSARGFSCAGNNTWRRRSKIYTVREAMETIRNERANILDAS